MSRRDPDIQPDACEECGGENDNGKEICDWCIQGHRESILEDIYMDERITREQ